jgi:hypothetical protein
MTEREKARNDRKYFTLTLPSPLKGEGKKDGFPSARE